MGIEGLGYIGVRAKDLGDWATYATNFLGLAEIRLAAGDTAGALDLLRRLAVVVGNPFENLDPAAALAALNDTRLAGLVERDFQDGVARGVSKTPTVFVSGKPFIETFSFEDLSHALDDALVGR